MSSPLALSDHQLTIIRRLAEPLLYGDRGAYLERVGQLLRTQAEIGDGVVHRAALRRRANSGECRRRLTDVPSVESTGADDEPRSRAY